MKRLYITGALILLSVSMNAQKVLTLEEIKDKAVQHNVRMRSAANEIRQAEQQKKETLTKYFPQVSAMGTGFKTSKGVVKTDINTADIIPASLASLIPSSIAAYIPSHVQVNMLDEGIIGSVTAIQPVFMGGQIVNGNKLAKVGVEVKQLQYETTRDEVELNAEKYYWQIISLKEKQKTLQKVREMLAKLEKDASVAVEAGVGMRNDLLQVQLKQNEVESNELKLQNGLKLVTMILAQYIGMEGQDVDVVSSVDSSAMPFYPTIKVNHDQALAETPEFKLLEKNVEATRLQRKMEVGKHLPMVAVGAGYNYTRLLDTNNNFAAVFATVSIPISDWWGGSHAIKRKKLAEQNAHDLLSDNAQLLKIRMQKNWNDVDDAYKQLELAKKGILQNEENLRLNRDYYHAGTVTMNDLLDAQTRYQQCCDNFTDAYAQLQIKILEYKQATHQQ